MPNKYEVIPHIHGDWAVRETEYIDVTCKDNKGAKQVLSGSQNIIFTGSMAECEEYKKFYEYKSERKTKTLNP